VLDMLRVRKDSLTPETREKLEAALWEQAQRLRQLTDQILDLSRLDARSIEIRPEPLALEPFLRGIASRVDPERAGDVQVDADAELRVNVDAGALDRVLSNLVANALEYGAPPVVLSARRDETKLQIRVEDAGKGIDPERAAQIFDRFERGEDSQGSGLGLAIARTYARAHGGELVHRPGAGSRFDLVLPLSN
jgi:signal transduction histidine kinase